MSIKNAYESLRAASMSLLQEEFITMKPSENARKYLLEVLKTYDENGKEESGTTRKKFRQKSAHDL